LTLAIRRRCWRLWLRSGWRLRMRPSRQETPSCFACQPASPRSFSICACVCAAAHVAPRSIAVAGCSAGSRAPHGERILRIIGLRRERHFVNYHRVLNHAVWSSRQAARLLLNLLVSTFVSTGPIVLGVGDMNRTPTWQADQRQGHLSRPRCGHRSRSLSRPAACASRAIG
jgi:hypothetical protein